MPSSKGGAKFAKFKDVYYYIHKSCLCLIYYTFWGVMLLSKQSVQSLLVLGQMLSVARLQRRWSQQELATRLGVSRITVRAIEAGQAKTAIGTVFEAAVLLGIPLMTHDKKQLSHWQTTLDNFKSLLPTRPRKKPEIDDDF